MNSELGIITQSWSPIGRGRALLEAPEVVEPARRAGVTPGQVVLRWHHQRGLVPLPRSSSVTHQRDNLDLTGFELSSSEMAQLNDLGRHGRRLWGGDPQTTTL